MIYMNNAATSYPKPDCVAEAVRASISSPPGAANRGGIGDFDMFGLCRKKLTDLIGGKDENRMILTSNATHSLNLAIFGFPFNEGDKVVASLAEHNSVLRPLYELKRRGLVEVEYVPTDKYGRIDIELWEKSVSGARMAVFTHASNVTGAVNDAALLSSLARRAGAVTLLDASQSIGLYDIKAGDFDMVAFTGHKYLLGPMGSGGLYIGEAVSLNPTLFGGTGIHSDEVSMPKELPLRLEAGTGNEPAAAGLAAALDWQERNPLDRALLAENLDRIRSGLLEAGANVIIPPGSCTPVVSFTVDGFSCEDMGYYLGSVYDIVCRVGLVCAPLIHSGLEFNNNGTVRLSMSRFTSIAEIDETVSAVRESIW